MTTTEAVNHRRPVPIDHTCDGTNVGQCKCYKTRQLERQKERRKERTAARQALRDEATPVPAKLPKPTKVQMPPLTHTCGEEPPSNTCECVRTWNREYQRKRRRGNSGGSAAANRRLNLWRLYKITPEQYDEMHAAQGGRCAICLRHESEVTYYVGGRPRLDGTPAAKRGLVVDHCHTGGQIRSLLCSGCNQGIGAFHDDVSRLRAAADWLERVNSTGSPIT